MIRQEMPIFTRTFDFLSWLLPATNHFPRPTATRLRGGYWMPRSIPAEYLEEANQEKEQQEWSGLSARMKRCLACGSICGCPCSGAGFPGGYKHGSQMVAEIGRLLGGWQKVTKKI